MGTLQAEDPDDDEVTFSVQGSIGNALILLRTTGPFDADILLDYDLDYEVSCKAMKYRSWARDCWRSVTRWRRVT